MTISSNIACDFNKRIGLKVITGLDNFNIQQVRQMTKAAEIAGATYVDIAADTDIISELQSICTLPICVSDITPSQLLKCQRVGIQVLEIGNYDCFYKNRRLFSPKEIIDISKEIRDLSPTTTLCVTVPHILAIEEQIKLAHSLQNIGVDIIQTEGKSTNFAKQGDLSGIMRRSSSTVSSTYAISKAINLPVISASGISTVTSPISFMYGASCVGIGTNIKRLQNIDSMVMYIHEVKAAICINQSGEKNINHSIRSSKINKQLIAY